MSVTLRQYHLSKFYRLLAAYNAAKKTAAATEEERRFFIRLALELNAAKVHVPKRLWPLINQRST